VQSADRAHFNNLYTEATVLYQTKRYSEAITYAQKALAILPEDPRPYAIIAHAMAHMKIPEAPEWAKKAIARDPTNGFYRGCLANTYTIRGKWKEGLEILRESVSLFPENADLQSGLGLCLVRTKKHGEALPHLQKAVELDPQNAYYRVRLSNALLRLKDKKGADSHLRTALALKPDDSYIQNTLGWQLRVRGKGSEADETFREALRLNPQNPAAKVGLGVPAGRRGGITDALLRFSIVIGSIPYRRVLIPLHAGLLAGLLSLSLNSPYASLWQFQLIATVVSVWVIYYLCAWLVVKIIARRRGVYFY
jgi:Flp pilus assembly protein TadD